MKRIIYAVGTLILFVLGLVLILNQRTKPVAEDRVLIHENCTVIMVGKKASVDGSTMTTHTADCG
ncbi:MAG: C69 family dipeptidase, partial [Candidatus Saccharicenans sp.]|nr:C69 family dipeptidase [Candidatus Saccharicenans sp.]